MSEPRRFKEFEFPDHDNGVTRCGLCISIFKMPDCWHWLIRDNITGKTVKESWAHHSSREAAIAACNAFAESLFDALSEPVDLSALDGAADI